MTTSPRLPTAGRAVRPFLALNDELKELCGRWQLRDGAPNDHADAALRRGGHRPTSSTRRPGRPVVAAVGSEVARLAPYERRLSEARQRFAGGETNMFTGVMCSSYHDVWMELHEDLILTLGIDRAKEGSF